MTNAYSEPLTKPDLNVVWQLPNKEFISLSLSGRAEPWLIVKTVDTTAGQQVARQYCPRIGFIGAGVGAMACVILSSRNVRPGKMNCELEGAALIMMADLTKQASCAVMRILT